jgi:hypothetical protein
MRVLHCRHNMLALTHSPPTPSVAANFSVERVDCQQCVAPGQPLPRDGHTLGHAYALRAHRGRGPEVLSITSALVQHHQYTDCSREEKHEKNEAWVRVTANREAAA